MAEDILFAASLLERMASSLPFALDAELIESSFEESSAFYIIASYCFNMALAFYGGVWMISS